jgi:hypothetical protein
MVRSTTILLIITSAIVSFSAARSQLGAQAGARAGGQASVQAGQSQASGNISSSASLESDQTNAGLASGTAFNTALSTPVDSKKAKPGDNVNARTTEAVKSGGKMVLPKGTTLVGHVTQASARAKGDSESALAITFDRAILKDGKEVPLNVAIQAIASAQAGASAADADMSGLASMDAGAAGSGRSVGGALGGVTSSAGSAVGTVANTAPHAGNTAGGAVNSTVNSTTNVAGASRGAAGGVNAAGQLTSNSSGVFGLSGLSLTSAAANSTQGSVITSVGKNVHLDGGTRMLLVTQTSASPNPKP